MRSWDIWDSVHAEAFLVSYPPNLRYLTNVSIDSGVLLIRPRSQTLFVYALEEEYAKRHVHRGIRVRMMSDWMRSMQGVQSCGFESDRVLVSDLIYWTRKFKNTKFVRCMGIIERLRRQKSPKELQHIKHALAITEKLLSRVFSALKTFPTEEGLAWELTCLAHTLGAEGMAFPPIVAFGPHTSRPHHWPTNRKLKKGDVVQIDIGAKVNGYCADRSEVYFTGKPSRLESQVHDAVREAKDVAIAAVKPGMTTHALDHIARSVLKKHGFEKYFCHGLGHGVGLEIHEGVSLSSKFPDTPLLKNEVITIEPGVYIPGKFGMRLEDMVFV